jgi:iron complex outermembrane receptor protein
MLSSRNKIFLLGTRIDLNSAYQNTELAHIGEKNIYEIQMRLGTLTYDATIHLPSDKYSEYILGYQGLYQVNMNINERETKLLPDANTLNNSLFFLIQKTLLKKLKLQAGLRYDARKIDTRSIGTSGDADFRPALEKHYSSISGSAGMTCNLSEALLIRTNLASAYRTPNLAELTSNGLHETRYERGDPYLRPEKSYELDLSIHYHRDNFTIDLAAYYNHINDYIFIAPTGDTVSTGEFIYRYRQGDSRLYGGEAGFHFHPQSLKWLHLLATYSNVTGEMANGTNLPFIPANKIYSEVKWEKDRFRRLYDLYFMISGSFTFRQARTAPGESVTAGYALFDLIFGADIPVREQKIAISAGITNLFDRKYIDHLSTLKEVGFFNPGRSFTLSLRIPFKI